MTIWSKKRNFEFQRQPDSSVKASSITVAWQISRKNKYGLWRPPLPSWSKQAQRLNNRAIPEKALGWFRHESKARQIPVAPGKNKPVYTHHQVCESHLGPTVTVIWHGHGHGHGHGFGHWVFILATPQNYTATKQRNDTENKRLKANPTNLQIFESSD